MRLEWALTKEERGKGFSFLQIVILVDQTVFHQYVKMISTEWSKQNVLRKIAQNGNDNFWILHWQESSLPLSPHPRYPVHRRKWHSKYQCLRGRPGDARQGQEEPGSNSELVVTESGTWVRPKSDVPSPPIFPPELLVHTYPTGQVQMWSFRRENSCEDVRAGEKKITERPLVLGW